MIVKSVRMEMIKSKSGGKSCEIWRGWTNMKAKISILEMKKSENGDRL